MQNTSGVTVNGESDIPRKVIIFRDVPINRLQLALAILPIIGIGRLASDNSRYQPIIRAGRLSAETYYILFVFYLDH